MRSSDRIIARWELNWKYKAADPEDCEKQNVIEGKVKLSVKN